MKLNGSKLHINIEWRNNDDDDDFFGGGAMQYF